MKRAWVPGVLVLALLWGCGRDDAGKGADPHAEWFSTPTKVVEGIMHAYQTRNDSLYAAFLAEDFRYYFEPQGADSSDILGWGKEEEVVATGNLFKTPDVEQLNYVLHFTDARAAEGAGRTGWMVVPISWGEMVVSVRNKEAMQVVLNRQEIVLRPSRSGNPIRKWEIVEWHDYPSPEPVAGGE
jgi:hypothetical protein